MKLHHVIRNACGLVLAASLAGWAADARPLWDKHCAACHGKDGKGDTKMGRKEGARDYTDPKVQETIKDDAGFKAIKEGLIENGKVRMKPFGEKLSDEEIRALMAFVRSFRR